METSPMLDFMGAANPWDWWRAMDDLWRWGARAHDILHYDRADDAARRLIRQERLAGLLAHAREASVFYREHYRSVPLDAGSLTAYPPVTRSALMERFDDWVVDREIRKADLLDFITDPARIAHPYLDRYTIWTSSGTTGIPGIYVQDADALAVYAALATSRFEFGSGFGAGYLGTNPSRFAFLAAIDGHFAGIVSWERQRRLYPAIAMATRAFSILQPLPDLVAQLNDWRPAYISTYPTMLTLLAAEQRAGRLRIEPRGLWCGGEGLCDADRANIEGVFGCPIVEDYGASECMNMAFGCSHGRLHVNEDWAILEAVDEHYRPVPPGEPSMTVLVTNLANRVQPLIRYDLGDSVTFDPEPCPCGGYRPVIQVEGRRDDVLVLAPRRRGEPAGASPAGAMPAIRILPLAVETVIEEETHIHRFQLVQTAPDAVTLRLDIAEPADRRRAFARVEAVLARYFDEQGVAPVRFTFDPHPPECDPVSGKLRQIRVLPQARAAD